ncbi:hypothetical protein MNBD_GAMMA16-77 [hydrothermal vent metagenome]|uniref:Peptidase S54 rhomboid domain-containing protein n=1 Tax=hydrothermal vent metagenome TaxID=652676 RepID=A0A3B0ZCT3_9ZZZZ
MRFTSLIIPSFIVVASIFIETIGVESKSILRFERDLFNNNTYWQLITGHLVHLGPNHLLLNLIGFALIGWLFLKNIPWHSWLILFIVTCLGVTSGLYLFNPELSWYVGLSGVLHGFLIYGIFRNIASGYRYEWLLLLAITGKLAWEQVFGAMPGSAETAGGPVIVDAHLYGALTGLLIACCTYLPKIWRKLLN